MQENLILCFRFIYYIHKNKYKKLSQIQKVNTDGETTFN